MSIDDIWAAARSTTSRAWLTNPIRNALFIVARPYLAEISLQIERSSDRFSDAVARLQEAARGNAEDVTASLSLSAALKEEMQRLSGLLAGIRKDQLAWGYRLSSLEEGIDDARIDTDNVGQRIASLEQQLEAFGSRSESLSAPAGMATLRPGHPVAVPATSLVLSSGPYGSFMLRQPDLISDHILAGSFWDQHLKPVIERAGRSGGSAIDAGAYLGFHTAYMSRFFKSVWAFEPQTEIYRMLCANLLLNNCRNVTAMNQALYDTATRLRIGDDSRQEIPLPVVEGKVNYDRVGNAAALTFQIADESDPTSIQAQTIDGLGLDDLAFIKIDTQGSDLHVLKGGRTAIQRCRPVITAEYERELAGAHGNTLEEFYGFFDEMGYDVQVLDDRRDGKQIDLLATPR